MSLLTILAEVDTDVPNPGRDEAVVTDAAILAAVSAIVNPAPVEE